MIRFFVELMICMFNNVQRGNIFAMNDINRVPSFILSLAECVFCALCVHFVRSVGWGFFFLNFCAPFDCKKETGFDRCNNIGSVSVCGLLLSLFRVHLLVCELFFVSFTRFHWNAFSLFQFAYFTFFSYIFPLARFDLQIFNRKKPTHLICSFSAKMLIFFVNLFEIIFFHSNLHGVHTFIFL